MLPAVLFNNVGGAIIQDFPVMLSCAFTLIGLDSLFTTLKNRIRITKDPLPPVADPRPKSGTLKKELPAMDVQTARAAVEHALTIFTEPSWEGVFSLAAVIATALVSGFIVMFVDLSIP